MRKEYTAQTDRRTLSAVGREDLCGWRNGSCEDQQKSIGGHAGADVIADDDHGEYHDGTRISGGADRQGLRGSAAE